MEKDICFAVMLSLVSRDPSFQIWRGYCWVSCAEAVFCAFVRLKVWEGAPFQASLNDNTLATIVQLSRAVFYHTNANHYITRGKNLFSALKSLQLALRAVILSWIHRALLKSLNWSKSVIALGFCRVFFSTDDNRKSHDDIDFFPSEYAIFKELKSPPF